MRAPTAYLAVAVLLAVSACSSQPETVNVSADMVLYDSVEAMAADSTMVFVGTVIEVKDGFFEPAPETEDFKGTQFLSVVVEVENVLQGAADTQTVAIRWFGYDVEADGSRGPQEIVNGEGPPRVGERNLWFVTDIPGYIARTGGEGRLEISETGEILSPTGPYSSKAAKQLEGRTIDELRQDLSSSS